MKRWRSLLVFLLILTLVFSLAAALSGCTKSDGIDRVAEFGQSALECEDYKREGFYPYSSNVFVSIIRADSQMLSYLLEWNEYCGGVHPSTYYEGFNLDVKTGDSISLDQVVSDIPALKALVMEKLLAEDGEDAFYTDLDALLADYFAWDEEAELYRPSWTLGEESLTIWFSPYEIAPYAAGLLQAEIRFDEVPEIFTGAYLPPECSRTTVPSALPPAA